MNRSTCVLVLGLVCSLLMLGCGGGGGGTTSPPPAQNPVPTIGGVTPSSVIEGAPATAVAITGTGFIASSSVELNGTAIPTTYDSTSSLSATLPASNLANAAVGKLSVVNPSPGGGASSTVDFAIDNPTPAIASVNPASITAGASGTVVDVTGTGFVATSTVWLNGTTLTTNFVSATELKASVPASDVAGSSASHILVVNPSPGGGSSMAVAFTVNSSTPIISSISPRLVPPGTSATITVTGTGFEANSMVLWNGAARPTTVMSTTVLQVTLSATDLQAQGAGALTVSNPGPGALSSGSAQLVVSQQLPTIQSVLIAVVPRFSNQVCPQLQITVTGQNFDNSSTIQANGVGLYNFASTPNVLAANLPGGFTSQPGGLTLTVTNQAQFTSDPFTYPASSPAVWTICGTPLAATVYSGSTFSIIAQVTEVNLSGNGNLTLGSLPAGITVPNGSVTLPPSGTTLHLQAAANATAGTYDIPLNATFGSATVKGDFYFTVGSGTAPGFFFQAVQTQDVLGIPIGGSGSLQFGADSSDPSAPVDYDITPSITGLPAGTTATFSPSVFTNGQTLTVTLNAASTAPVTQNAVVTVTATPAAQTGPVSTNFYADVTQPPGSLPGNRSDFTPLGGTPYAAVYDATHNLIFASNPDWNRVEVISNATHKVVARIPVKSPRGLDITQDNSHVWVQSASLNVYEIDTTTLHAQQYSLPNATVRSSGLSVFFAIDRLFALSDGTLFVSFNDHGDGNGAQSAVWNPQTNQERVISGPPISYWGTPMRSGDGTHVYATNTQPGSLGLLVYNVSSQSTSSINLGSGNSNLVAVNHDGSRFVLFTVVGGQAAPVAVFDQNLNLIGALPGGLSSYFPAVGGVWFSADGTKIYIEGIFDGLNTILTVDGGSLNLLGASPAAVTNPNRVSGEPGIPSPFAVDSTGMVLGLQDYGIAFDDSTLYQNYVMNQPQEGAYSIYGGPFATPLAGGAVSGFNPYSVLIPDIWFGASRGSANIAQGTISFVAPPSTTPGPVNVKLIYPDGEEVFYPQWFSYSTNPEYAVTSGSSPSGGATGLVVGYGLPQDASGGTVTVGGNTATITTVAGQYPAYTQEPLPSTTLAYTFPVGQPGWADLTVGTPNGTGTLPKSIFYASSVTDYASTDTFTAVLFDANRSQVYLSAGDHVDVFSTATNQFLTPLQPAAVGAQKQFTGLALSPDGSQLVVADLLDGSIAVINPDSPANNFAIALPASQPLNNCPVGPLYVAVTSANQVFLTEGSLPEPSCPNSGQGYVVNLTTKAVTAAQCSGSGVDAGSDGNFVAIGQPCLYSVQGGSYLTGTFLSYTDPSSLTISGDGNVVSTDAILGDIHMNMFGSIASPLAFYGAVATPLLPMPYPRSRLNASGSLFYRIYPNLFEIVDVQHGTLRMRFGLTEVIQDTAAALAIDSGGRHVYLLTDHGLTVIDLGQAPLSIGHLSLTTAGAGTQVTVRGSGFDSGTTATVGGLAATVSFTDENTLTLTIPAAGSGPEDIVLRRAHGEMCTLENGVVLP